MTVHTINLRVKPVRIEIIRLKVAALTYWVCIDCGFMAQGDSVVLEPSEFTQESLNLSVSQIHPQNMPAGWAAYGDQVKCPRCKG